jgi:hypothetical protein
MSDFLQRLRERKLVQWALAYAAAAFALVARMQRSGIRDGVAQRFPRWAATTGSGRHTRIPLRFIRATGLA